MIRKRLSLFLALGTTAFFFPTILTGMNEGETVADAAVPQNNAMAPVQDVPGLPRVLLIGDSISISYTLPVRERLKGKANVHRIPVNGSASPSGVAGTHGSRSWLGGGKWDVIHFNFGIHDSKLKPETGLPAVSDEDYLKNLGIIAERLKATGAHVIFATSTPIPDSLLAPKTGEPLPPKTRLFVDIKKRNDLAVTALKQQGVTINDLYAVIFADREKFWRKNDLHFSPEGSALLADAVVASIEQALASKK